MCYTIQAMKQTMDQTIKNTSPKVLREVPPFSMLMRIAWRNYTRRFDVILYANLLIILPINIALDLTSPRHLYTTQLTTVSDPFILLTQLAALFSDSLYVTNLLLQIVSSFLLMYVVTAIVLMLKRIYDRKLIVTSEVLQEAMRFFPRVFVVTLLTKILVGLAFFAFIIPGIIVSIFLSFAVPALVWHDMKPWAAIVKSYQAVRKNWWSVFFNLLTVNLIITSIILITIIFIPDTLGFKTIGLTIATIISSFVPLFSTVLFAALDLDFTEEGAQSTPL